MVRRRREYGNENGRSFLFTISEIDTVHRLFLIRDFAELLFRGRGGGGEGEKVLKCIIALFSQLLVGKEDNERRNFSLM